MTWDIDTINLLVVCVDKGWTHKDIAYELNLTESCVAKKSYRLGLNSKNNKLKDIAQYKIQLPKDIKVLEEYINTKTPILHKHVCGHIWKVRPNNILSGFSCPKCGNIVTGSKLQKTTLQYKRELPKDIEVLEEYTGAHNKILHKHLICNYIWKVRPSHILQGSNCPSCNTGFNPNIKGYTYCIYFSELNLYKVGITNNIKNRMKSFTYIPEILFTREFDKGSDAKSLETKWLQNVSHLKVNTGLLRSGNTETFIAI